jgi:hypothetical protein
MIDSWNEPMEIELWHGLLKTTLEADDREGEEDEKE